MEIVKLSKEDGMESLLHFSKTDNFGGKVAFVAANQLFAVSVLRPHSLSLVSLCCMSLFLSLSLKIHGKWKQLRSPPSVRSILFLNALFSFSLLWILIFSLLMYIWVGTFLDRKASQASLSLSLHMFNPIMTLFLGLFLLTFYFFAFFLIDP